jgi:2-keto-4-pentenoate hydratase/2-oxohepta-3-ene-1,7-dioic acid hydratase in catechol pathway
VISTGTPGAVVIHDGDVVECRITGFEPLSNPVVQEVSDRPGGQPFPNPVR